MCVRECLRVFVCGCRVCVVCVRGSADAALAHAAALEQSLPEKHVAEATASQSCAANCKECVWVHLRVLSVRVFEQTLSPIEMCYLSNCSLILRSNLQASV